MDDKQYDLIVYIGRFQPFHVAHQKTVEQAKKISKNVLILIGSSQATPSIDNPFSAITRQVLIQGAVKSACVEFVKDCVNEYDWVDQVYEKVTAFANKSAAHKIAIIGHEKDSSSYYLNYFPQWDHINVDKFPVDGRTINATTIRNLMFEGDYKFIEGVVPDNIYDYIVNNYLPSKAFIDLRMEYDEIKAYKKAWDAAPYAPIFVTTDAVVVQSGHVLLIKRDGYPGKGLWAMPGGFIEPDERLFDGVIRELREETKLKVPEKVIRGSLEAEKYYDKVSRSSRGRTITHAFLFKLDDSIELPKVKGNIEEGHVEWIPIPEFHHMESKMFEDHYNIVTEMINKIKV